ncbi:Nucleic acid-binding, OB-fold [Sesbania bispinosa]|nr:Nucleic acid-binding, OB-fold [Sesbania bispinosa]
MEQPGNPFAIEMVMIDAQGGKIQATIHKPMIRKFRGALVEGRVYRMIFFGVVKNIGSYRACRHEFKLLFHGRTRVAECKGVPIPMYGLSLMTTEDIKNTGGRPGYLFGNELPVVVVQLGRVKSYKGDITIQNVVNTTKIIWNPDIPEVQSFKNRYGCCFKLDKVGVS